FGRGNFAHIAIIRSAGGIVIDVDAGAAAPRPRLQFDRAQIAYVMSAYDLEPLGANPTLVRRIAVLLRRKFCRQLFRYFDVCQRVLLTKMAVRRPMPSPPQRKQRRVRS